ncbi:MAG: hypothetical protein QOK21_3120 [Solirubrobacteraceae bacterium]|jgi:hypothetical protein|nr:hypothetical protein [Solirubrobacteraceae bacterium]
MTTRPLLGRARRVRWLASRPVNRIDPRRSDHPSRSTESNMGSNLSAAGLISDPPGTAQTLVFSLRSARSLRLGAGRSQVQVLSPRATRKPRSGGALDVRRWSQDAGVARRHELRLPQRGAARRRSSAGAFVVLWPDLVGTYQEGRRTARCAPRWGSGPVFARVSRWVLLTALRGLPSGSRRNLSRALISV